MPALSRLAGQVKPLWRNTMILPHFPFNGLRPPHISGLAIAGEPTLGFSQTIDQQNVGPVAIHYTDLNKGDDFELLQSFTAEITGTLDRIALPVYEDVIIPPPYNKDVPYSSSATVTILDSKLAVLGSALIPAASISNTSSTTGRARRTKERLATHYLSYLWQKEVSILSRFKLIGLFLRIMLAMV